LLIFSRRNLILLAVIWGYFKGKQHQILPTYWVVRFEEKWRLTRLFQPTCLLKTWE
jgi:hypothetical protein